MLSQVSMKSASDEQISAYDVAMEKYRKVLETQREALLQTFEPKDVVRTLVARRAIQYKDMAEIYSKNSKNDRLTHFLNVLQKNTYWWGPFIDALIRNGHSHLAHILLGTLNDLNGVIR